MLNISFVNNGADEALLKSMAVDEFHEYNQEELEKAMDRSKLVQKEIQYKTKNGKIATRKQWVRAGEDQKGDKPTKAQGEEPKKGGSLKWTTRKDGSKRADLPHGDYAQISRQGSRLIASTHKPSGTMYKLDFASTESEAMEAINEQIKDIERKVAQEREEPKKEEPKKEEPAQEEPDDSDGLAPYSPEWVDDYNMLSGNYLFAIDSDSYDVSVYELSDGEDFLDYDSDWFNNGPVATIHNKDYSSAKDWIDDNHRSFDPSEMYYNEYDNDDWDEEYDEDEDW